MPAITRNGVTMTEALQEHSAIAPLGRALLYAYELWHPTLPEPFRFVDDVVPLTATLEATAPRDPGATVEFISCPLSMQRPEESDTASNPTISMGRPDVSGELKRVLDTARGSLEPWVLIERVYASDDTSEPALLPPLQYEVDAVGLSQGSANLSASYGDHINEAVPRITFRRDQYPGLTRG